MTKQPRDESAPGLDTLRKAYRAANFTDEPPPHVDAFIRAAAKQLHRRRLHGYLPPLAMAATVVLALGLVLRLTALGPEPAEQPREAIPQLAPRAAEPAAATEEAVAPALDSPASPDLAPDPASARAFRGIEEPRESVEEGLASSTAAGAVLNDVVVRARLSQVCDPRPADPEAWLACIAAAVDAGALDAARTELDAFRREFPDYAVPEPLAAGLAP